MTRKEKNIIKQAIAGNVKLEDEVTVNGNLIQVRSILMFQASEYSARISQLEMYLAENDGRDKADTMNIGELTYVSNRRVGNNKLKDKIRQLKKIEDLLGV